MQVERVVPCSASLNDLLSLALFDPSLSVPSPFSPPLPLPLLPSPTRMSAQFVKLSIFGTVRPFISSGGTNENLQPSQELSLGLSANRRPGCRREGRSRPGSPLATAR